MLRNIRIKIIFIMFAFVILHLATASVSQTQPKIIIDTDFCLDQDDLGAMATLHALADNGECEILAVIYDEEKANAADALDVVNTWYQRPALPIGIYPGTLSGDDAWEYEGIYTMTHDLSDNVVDDAVTVYESVLAAQPDNSVTILCVGYFVNLHALIIDNPTGLALVEDKVERLIIQEPLGFGGFNATHHNLTNLSIEVINNWPTTVVFSDFGDNCYTGAPLAGTDVDNPIREGWRLECNFCSRPSWDQAAVLYAVRGSENFNTLSSGSKTIGSQTWPLTTNPPAKLHASCFRSNSYMADLINDLMIQPPKEGSYYTLSTSVNGSGSITLDPAGGTYDEGTTVTVTANPGSGAQFDNWSGDASGTNNPITITMGANKSITANFSGGTGPDPEVTGTLIGTDGYNSGYGGGPIAAAVDGNTSTFFDAPSSDNGWVGYDFGSGNEKIITRLRYYPRASFASRMNGGVFQGANNSNFSGAVNLHTISSTPPYAYTEVDISNGTGFRYVRYLAPDDGWGNIAEVDFYGHDDTTTTQYTLSTSVTGSGSITLDPAGGTYDEGTTVTVTASPASGWQFDNWSGDASGTNNPITITMNTNKSITANFSDSSGPDLEVTGTLIGTDGYSSGYGGGPIADAVDGNTSTFFDAPSSDNGWVGYDFGSGNEKIITRLRYYPRASFASRMNGGVFQGANNSNFSGAVNLHTISSTPSYAYTQVDISNGTGFRYVRYLAPDDGWGNIAEVDFYGHDDTTTTQYTLSTSVTGSGSITLDPAGGTYDEGTTVTVTASPASGWQFDNWSGDASGTNNPITITMNTNKSIAANFSDSSGPDPEVTGTLIGTDGYTTGYGGGPIAAAVDGNTSTFFDAPSSDNGWVGYDFGSGNEKIITRLRYYPRASFASRMNGGVFQGADNSNFSGAVNLHTISSTPPYAYTEVDISNGTGFRYVRYLAPDGGWGNIAEVDFYGHDDTTTTQYTLSTSVTGSGSITLDPAGGTYDEGTTVTVTASPASGWQFDNWSGDASGTNNPITITMNTNKSITANFSDSSGPDPEVTGTLIGTNGYTTGYGGGPIADAVDGNTSTFFDAPSSDNGWVGYDFGSGNEKIITRLRYYPRASFASRMNGGVFQGADNSNFSGAVNLHTISSTPPYAYTEVDISNGTGFRYVRYLAPDGGWGNIAEVDFYGHSGLAKAAENFSEELTTSTPEMFVLQQNYPNPFNPLTKISYSLPKQSYVELKIFDILGNEVAVLVEGNQQAGSYVIEFDGTDFSSGIYLCFIRAAEFSAMNKMILMK